MDKRAPADTLKQGLNKTTGKAVRLPERPQQQQQQHSPSPSLAKETAPPPSLVMPDRLDSFICVLGDGDGGGGGDGDGDGGGSIVFGARTQATKVRTSAAAVSDTAKATPMHGTTSV